MIWKVAYDDNFFSFHRVLLVVDFVRFFSLSSYFNGEVLRHLRFTVIYRTSFALLVSQLVSGMKASCRILDAILKLSCILVSEQVAARNDDGDWFRLLSGLFITERAEKHWNPFKVLKRLILFCLYAIQLPLTHSLDSGWRWSVLWLHTVGGKNFYNDFWFDWWFRYVSQIFTITSAQW